MKSCVIPNAVRNLQFLTVAALVCLCPTLGAQEPNEEQRRLAITGLVKDNAGAVIGDAELDLQPADRTVKSGPSGEFRFTQLPRGKYILSVRRLGYAAVRLPVVVRDTDVALEVKLAVVPVRFGEIHVKTDHVGLFGTVVDSAGSTLADAEVRAFPGRIGVSDSALVRMSHHFVRSDADGTFFLPLAPGPYVVRINRPGFGVMRLDVSVPVRGGRCIMVRLAAADARRDMREVGCEGP